VADATGVRLRDLPLTLTRGATAPAVSR
jgi:CO/xanthine dehydrogenase Mo-binding subunit